MKATRFLFAILVCLGLAALLIWVLDGPVSPANASGRPPVQDLPRSATPGRSLSAGSVTSNSPIYLPLILHQHVPSATPTPTPTLTPNPPLFFDGFDNPDSGWPAGEDDYVKYGYVEGEYQIYLKTANRGLLNTAGLNNLPANYRVEADVRQVSSDPVSLGLAFDMIWNGNPYAVYRFRIDPDFGDYLLEKRDLNGTWQTLIDRTPNEDIINPGNATNHLRVDRVGSSIRLYINGVNVNTYVDGELAGPGRDAGLYARSYVDFPAEARFDNFRVTELP